MNSQSNQVTFNSSNDISTQLTWSPFSTPYLFDSTANFSPNFQYSVQNYQSNCYQNSTSLIGNYYLILLRNQTKLIVDNR